MASAIEGLRRSIATKRSIVDVAMDCLYFTAVNPDTSDRIGICWSHHPSVFLLATKVFSSFVARKPNTVRRNLHDHGFRTCRTSDYSPALLRAHRYAAWSHPNLNQWLPRERIGPFLYHEVPEILIIPIPRREASKDTLWEAIEMIQPAWDDDPLQVTEEQKWFIGPAEDSEL
jgi:hypothetical protein